MNKPCLLLLTAMMSLFSAFPLTAQSELSYLLRIWENEAEPDTNRLWAIDSIALVLYPNQPDSMLYYATQQLEFATEIENQRWIGISEQNIGNSYYFLGDLTNALVHYERSLVAREASGDKRGTAGMLINVGIQYGGMGEVSKSQEYTLRALKITEEIGDKVLEANALGRLGTLNFQIGNIEEAEEYFLRAYRTNEESGLDKGLLASSLVNLGIFYAQQEDFEEALPYTLQSVELFQELNGLYGLADAYGNLGYIYSQTDELEEALRYSKLSLNMTRQIKNQHGEATQLSAIGDLLMDLKNYPEALSAYEEAKELLALIGDEGSLKDISLNLYLAYKAIGDDSKALAMHEQWVSMRDSLEEDEQAKEILRRQFEFEQEKKDALAEAELAQQNLQRNASLIGLGLMGILAVVLFRNSQKRRQTNQLLSSQNTQIEAKSQQNELLLKEIHHRVKNNLQTISSLLYLQSAHIQDADIKQAVAAGRHRVESMALIQQKLYQRDNLAAIEMKEGTWTGPGQGTGPKAWAHTIIALEGRSN